MSLSRPEAAQQRIHHHQEHEGEGEAGDDGRRLQRLETAGDEQHRRDAPSVTAQKMRWMRADPRGHRRSACR